MRVRPRTVFMTLSVAALAILCSSAQSQVLKAPAGSGWNVVQGFAGNSIQAEVRSATIGGGGLEGLPNLVSGDAGSVGGGAGNRAGESATVAGGLYNSAEGYRSAIGGGGYNVADRDGATVAGGYGNRAIGGYATIAGGTINAALEVNAAVGGGSGNTASERHTFVGGGTSNTASGFASLIAGGVYNASMAAYAAVGGGISNAAKAREAVISGGAGNTAEGDNCSIGGGLNNRISANYATIAGGRANKAGNPGSGPGDAAYASVGGGDSNQASGAYSVVPGGAFNSAGGAFSLAAGRRAKVQGSHAGAMVFADATDSDFQSQAGNEFAVRATGGARWVSAVDAHGDPLAGVRLAGGSGAWESLSDRRAKKDFTPVDSQEILKKVAELPLTSWSYLAQPSSIRHMGPTSQEFKAAFGLGEDERFISTADADGVALAAIQGLYRHICDVERQLAANEERMRTMEALIRDQQRRLEGSEQR
ncbi:MAG: tail fiber domain-containing protein [Hyphomicrobiales bacterium]